MDQQPQASAEMAKLAEIVEESRIAMMTTLEPDGAMRSRPLATLQMDSEGALWFFTAESSPKVEEIKQHRRVNLSYANLGEQDYVSISGVAEIVRDRQKMRDLWTPWVEPWFPKGVDDPDLILLRIVVEDAEYWDAPSGRAKRLYGLAKAMTTGDTSKLGENAKVRPH